MKKIFRASTESLTWGSNTAKNALISTFNPDYTSLKLFVDNKEHVWYGCANGPPTCSNQSVIEFLLNPICTNFNSYRLIGNTNNVQLILALYARRLQSGESIVEVCSPMIAMSKAERNDPQRAIYAMRQSQRASILGGWHIFQPDDLHAYVLANQIRKFGVNADTLKLLKSHPVWPALSYISHLNQTACALLLSKLLDIRWYADHMRPNRTSKLREFCGLNFKTVTSILSDTPGTYNQELCRLVIAAWDTGPKDLSKIEYPGYFLYRVFRASAQKGIVRAVLRTCQKLIDYIYYSWHAALHSHNLPKDKLFIPEYFFKNDEEIGAYNYHIKNFSDIV